MLKVKVKTLLFMFLCALIFSAGAQEVSGFTVNNKGLVSLDGVSYELVHFAKGWKHSAQSNAFTPSSQQKQADGSIVTEGTYQSAGGKLTLKETVSPVGDNSVKITWELQAASPVPSEDVRFVLSFPVSKYAGSQVIAGKEKIDLPRKQGEVNMKFPANVKDLRLGLSEGELVVKIPGGYTALQDNRKYGNQTFSVSVSPSIDKTLMKKTVMSITLSKKSVEATALDLSKVANMAFADEVESDGKGGWTDQGKNNDMRQLAVGKQVMGGLPIKIIDPAKNNNKSCIVLNQDTPSGKTLEARISGPLENFEYIYIVHASAWTPKTGEKLGDVIITYREGDSVTYPIRAGHEVGDWWGVQNLDNSKVAWRAENNGNRIGLFMSKFPVNRRSVQDITFRSSGNGRWMIVAAAASDSGIAFGGEVDEAISANDDWTPYESSLTVKKGGILDLSSVIPSVPIKQRLVVRNGHFERENEPGKPVRLMGSNLCFSANYLTNDQAQVLAQRFRSMGYNSVRLHHYDRNLMGGWGAKRGDTIVKEKLDRLDYMFHTMKEAGMYITIDLYTIRRFSADEIDGWDDPVEGEIKALVPVLEGAFVAWSRMVLELMEHVNPYTKMKWKDDPALFSVCPLNEDSLSDVWDKNPKVKKLYERKFANWLKAKGKTSANPTQREELMGEYLLEVKLASDKRIKDFLREHGVKALITGNNFLSKKYQTILREKYDFVDNHGYWDHPGFAGKSWSLPYTYRQNSSVASAAMMPRELFASRIYGKPFTVTEYNYCAPNHFRAEGGGLMGAYAALQDWDGLYRFDWADKASHATEIQPISGFDIATDPLSLMSERLAVLLFLRGDVTPAREKINYGISRAMATRKWKGWGGTSFPDWLGMQGLMHQVATFELTGKKSVPTSGMVFLEGEDVSIDASRLISAEQVKQWNSDKIERYQSDTKEVTLEKKKALCLIDTAKTDCIISAKSYDEAESGSLRVKNAENAVVVSVSSMDGKNIEQSGRMLLIHLSNMANSGMTFRGREHLRLEKWGKLPYLVRTSQASVSIKTDNANLKVWSVDASGKRIEQVNSAYKNARLEVQLVIKADAKPAVMAYEIIAQ